jgi:hypothetical protein
MSENERDGCEEVRDLLPELATGVAAGDDRARALAHLARCPECREELAELSGVVDELVLLAPSREPSPGFETAVLAAMSPRTRWRPNPAVLSAAAAVLGMLLAGGVVWQQTADDRDLAAKYRHTLDVADGQYFVAAPVVGGDQDADDTGTVFAYEGDPSWLFVNLERTSWSGRYEIQVVTTDGRIVDAGWCEVKDGKGSWGRTVAIPVHEISAVRLRAPGTGTLRATFRT